MNTKQNNTKEESKKQTKKEGEMKCQVCFKMDAIRTAFDEALGKRVSVCDKCKRLLESREETEKEKQESEADAEFQAELDAGCYNLP